MEKLSKTALARRIRRTATHITNLHSRGLPHVQEQNGRVWYDWDIVGPWWEEYLKEQGAADAKPQGEHGLRLRKLEAEARREELELFRLEGTLIPTEYAQKQLADVLAGIRAQVLAAPGKHAPVILHLKSVAAAQLALERIASDVLRELMTAAEHALDTPFAEPSEQPRGNGAGKKRPPKPAGKGHKKPAGATAKADGGPVG